MTTSTSQEIIVRVLLIEESKADARLILESLARTDKGRCHVTWVENLSSGLKYLSSMQMDVVLLDLDLPDGHGLERLSSLSQGIPQMPVIVLVSLANERNVETALRKGACDYLIKEKLSQDLLVRSIGYATKLGRARMALEEYKRRTRAIFDRTFEFIGLMSPDGILLEANRTALEFIGAEASAVLGKPFWETPWWGHSLEAQQRLRQAVRAAAGGEFVRFETTHKARDGGVACVDFSLKPVRDQDGKVVLLIPEGRDITDRKRAEEALRQSEETARALLNTLSDSAFLLDTDGNVLALNNPSAEALGKRTETLIGLSLFKYLPHDVAKRQERYFKEVVRSGSPIRFDDLREGRWLDTSMYPVFDAEGRVIRVAVFARDLTEEKRMAKALVQREKLKTLGAISAEVAHEIRNPLVSIGGFARRLQKKYPGLREADIILKESQRLETILGRIRDYLKPVEIRPRKCSVNDLLRDCVDLLSPELSGRGIRCHLDLTAGLSEAYVDAGILSQVFINLIRNAVEVTKEKQDLIISTAEDVSEIQVAFKHPASKLKSRDADLMFLPFDEGGQSIGLPLSYRLLKDMGGLLSYEEEMDKIVFTLSLPKFDLESVRDTENV